MVYPNLDLFTHYSLTGIHTYYIIHIEPTTERHAMPFSHIPHMSDKGYVEARRQKFMQMIAPFFDDAAMEMIEQSYFISKNAHRIQVRDDAGQLLVLADDDSLLVTIAGGVARGGSVGIGASAAYINTAATPQK